MSRESHFRPRTVTPISGLQTTVFFLRLGMPSAVIAYSVERYRPGAKEVVEGVAKCAIILRGPRRTWVEAKNQSAIAKFRRPCPPSWRASGLRKVVQATIVPSSTRVVTAASDASSDQHSQLPLRRAPGTPSASPKLEIRWSADQSESKPMASAC